MRETRTVREVRAVGSAVFCRLEPRRVRGDRPRRTLDKTSLRPTHEGLWGAATGLWEEEG